MAEKEPADEQTYLAEDATPIPCAEARESLVDAYWLAVRRPYELPHLVPVSAVRVDCALPIAAVAPGMDHGFVEGRELEPAGERAPGRAARLRRRQRVRGVLHD